MEKSTLGKRYKNPKRRRVDLRNLAYSAGFRIKLEIGSGWYASELSGELVFGPYGTKAILLKNLRKMFWDIVDDIRRLP